MLLSKIDRSIEGWSCSDAKTVSYSSYFNMSLYGFRFAAFMNNIVLMATYIYQGLSAAQSKNRM